VEQRATFDRVADLYDSARPGYPESLVDDVIATAGLAPGDAILEVGCGTGQATKSFAGRGLRILALDPGPELMRISRERLAGFRDIEFVTTTLEDSQSATGAPHA
jgi:ubiquinone/menaquinone biosynthesis C-methylase UbiE